MLRNKSLRQSGGGQPDDYINAIYNQDGTQSIILASAGQYDNIVKKLEDGTLTEFKVTDYNITTLKDARFKDFTSLTKLDLSGIKDIPEYTANGCTALTDLKIDNDITSVGQYAFYGCNNIDLHLLFKPLNVLSIPTYAFYHTRLNELVGEFTGIGDYAFAGGSASDDSTNALTKVHITVNGALGNYSLYGRQLVSDFNLDSSSIITGLGDYGFRNFGIFRQNPESNVFTFDFRNSTFTIVKTYCFAGSSSSSKNSYFDIYFSSNVATINEYAFAYSDYYNIYFRRIPTLTNTNGFSNATHYKCFFPYQLAQTAKTSTNWSNSTIKSKIYGFSEANEFVQGETLPVADSAGYELTWYSDAAMTTQVTTVSDATKMYYCSVGNQTYTRLYVYTYQSTCVITDGTNTYGDGAYVPIGTTLTITASGTGGNTELYALQLNNSNIVNGSTYTTTTTPIKVSSLFYDGVTPLVDDVFANNTPAQVKIAVDSGLCNSKWSIGDTRNITLSNDTVISLMFVDGSLNRYKKSDASGYSNGVFELGIFMTAPMNTVNYNRVWGDTDMCTTTLPSIYDLLPSEWKSVISEVRIPTAVSKTNDTIVYADNKLFLASAQELFGNYASGWWDEGCYLYQWYSGRSASQRIKYLNGTAVQCNSRSKTKTENTTASYAMLNVNGNYATWGSNTATDYGVLAFFAI